MSTAIIIQHSNSTCSQSSHCVFQSSAFWARKSIFSSWQAIPEHSVKCLALVVISKWSSKSIKTDLCYVCFFVTTLGELLCIKGSFFFSPTQDLINSSHQDQVFQIIYSEVFKLALQNELGRSDPLRISSALTVSVHTVSQFPDLILSRTFFKQSWNRGDRELHIQKLKVRLKAIIEDGYTNMGTWVICRTKSSAKKGFQLETFTHFSTYELYLLLSKIVLLGRL